MKFVPGITEHLVGMVYDRLLDHRSYSRLAGNLGKDGIRKCLENMEWVSGFYDGDECVAAMWSTGELMLVTRKGYENKWVSPKTYRQFWSWFFRGHAKAVVTPDNGMVIPFLLRMGFRWENNKLVMVRNNLRFA